MKSNHSFYGTIILLCATVLSGCSGAASEAPAEADRLTAETQSLTTDWGTDVVDVEHNIPHAAFKTVRVARQDGFDRSVFEFHGNGIPGYYVAYDDTPLHCGVGEPVVVAGAHKLEVVMRPSYAVDENGQPTYSPLSIENIKPNLTNMRELQLSCTGFEGETDYVIGLAAKKNFRVLELQNPPRIVVDVQH